MLIAKQIVIPAPHGREVYYLLNETYFRKGSRKRYRTNNFIKVYNSAVIKVLPWLNTNARALFFAVLPFLQYQSNVVIDEEGKPMNQTMLKNLMRWSKKQTITEAIESLIKHGVLLKFKQGKQYIYMAHPVFAFKGGITKQWQNNCRVKELLGNE